MTVTSKMKKLAAVAVLGALSIGGMATTAHAIDVEAGKTGSITVHKHFGTAGEAGNGKATTIDASKPPLSGVKFKLEKANLDLTKNADWEKAAKLAKGEKVDGVTFAPQGSEMTTNAKGEAKFDNLPLGLYKVIETDTTGAMKNGTEKVEVSKIAPFYVTLPMTDPVSRDKWMYDVHVYPKNQAFDVEKKGKLVAGDKMEYTVTATLPDFAQGKDKYTRYNLWDVMSAHHDVNTFTLTKVEAIKDANDNAATDLTGDANYTVNKEAAQNRVKVAFNETGLGLLTNAKKAGKASVRYTYTVDLKKDFKKGDLDNTATIIPSEDYDDAPAGNGDDKPNGSNKEKFVSFKIKKISSDGDKPLQGAKFDLYACTADGKFADKDGKAVEMAQALKLAADLESGADGLTGGDRIPVTGTDVAKVCAVETKAPEKYTLLSEPIVMDVNDNDTHEVQQSIKNVPANAGFNLPLTGSQSLVILSLAGVALIAGAIIVTSRNRKNA